MALNVSIGSIYGYKSNQMTDHVIVKVVDAFFEKCRVEVIDHRGNIKKFPFFERLVLKSDLFEFPEKLSAQQSETTSTQNDHFLRRVELNGVQVSILQTFVNGLLTTLGKRPKDLLLKTFGNPLDLDQVKNTASIQSETQEKNVGVTTLSEANSVLTKIHQKIIELSLMDPTSLSEYLPVSERCRKLMLNENQLALCNLFLTHQLKIRDKRVNDLYTKLFGEVKNIQNILATPAIDSGGQKFLIGKITLDEANLVLEELQLKALSAITMDATQLRTATLFYHLKMEGYELEEFSEEAFVDEYSENNFLQLFIHLLQSPIFFKPNHVAVCNAFFLSDEEITLDELGKQLDLTRERVRQIKWTLFEKIPQLITKCLYPLYLQDCREALLQGSDSDLVILSGEILESINESHDVVLGTLGYIMLYKSLLPNHSLLGLESISTNPKAYSHVQNRYLNYYMVPNRLFSWIDFQRFMDSLYNKLSHARLQGTVIEEEFFGAFLRKKKESKGSKEILKQILSEEFDIIFEDGKVIIPGTRQSRLLQLETLLREAGRPMKLDEIFTIAVANGIDLARSTVHAYLNEYKDKFSLVGLSTFAHVSQNIKSGMLVDLVEEYLTREGKPRKLDDIFREVQKHRSNVRRRTLRSNCENSPKRFIVKGSMIGLRARDSAEELTKADPDYISREQKWEQNYQNVVAFLKSKRRVPSSNRGTTERSLYNFISFNKKIFKRLSEDRQKKITNILKLYPTHSLPKYEDEGEDDWSPYRHEFY